MVNYRIGQRVKGIVENVYPFGVFVCLGDATKAYVRRRELDLDADLEPAQSREETDE